MSDEKVVELSAVRAGARKGAKCPICAKPTEADYKPFCSKRCADVDLGKWLDGGYAIPSEEVSGFDGAYDEDDE